MEIYWVLGLPLFGGIFLALWGNRGNAPEINAFFSLLTLIAAAVLTARIVAGGPMIVGGEGWFFIDSFNVFLVTLTAFVAFTTALFSRPYMRIEKEHGRLNDKRLRLYHSSYQIFIAAMLLALTTNNMGILWVSMEAATLATVLLVSLYRTPASLEAAWKYFILCGVGIAQALFGTILLYFAAEKVLGSGGTALLWTHLNEVKHQLEPTVMAARLHLPAGRLRHQGRPGAPAQLAARRPRRRSDAGFGGALRPAAERRAVRHPALQGAGRRRPRQ
jgi:hydrogenase-4 component F